VDLSEVELCGFVMSCVLRLPRQALCLCTAGCQAKGSRGPAAATAPQLLQKALSVLRLPRTREVRRLCVLRLPGKGSRGPAAATAPQLLQKALCTAPAMQKGSAEALCIEPARQRQPRASGGHRAAAPPESSVYCACQAKGSQEALCTARLSD